MKYINSMVTNHITNIIFRDKMLTTCGAEFLLLKYSPRFTKGHFH